MEEFLCATFFSLLTRVSFYCKGCAGNFFLKSSTPPPPPPPPAQKSNGPPLKTNSSVSLCFLQLKVKFFKDHSPNSRTFQGLEFSFSNFRTFQDFQGLQQSCSVHHFTYNFRHCDFVQLQGLRGLFGGDTSCAFLKMNTMERKKFHQVFQ